MGVQKRKLVSVCWRVRTGLWCLEMVSSDRLWSGKFKIVSKKRLFSIFLEKKLDLKSLKSGKSEIRAKNHDKILKNKRKNMKYNEK